MCLSLYLPSFKGRRVRRAQTELRLVFLMPLSFPWTSLNETDFQLRRTWGLLHLNTYEALVGPSALGQGENQQLNKPLGDVEVMMVGMWAGVSRLPTWTRGEIGKRGKVESNLNLHHRTLRTLSYFFVTVSVNATTPLLPCS